MHQRIDQRRRGYFDNSLDKILTHLEHPVVQHAAIRCFLQTRSGLSERRRDCFDHLVIFEDVAKGENEIDAQRFEAGRRLRK